jgi:hypothetical protein
LREGLADRVLSTVVGKVANVEALAHGCLGMGVRKRLYQLHV